MSKLINVDIQNSFGIIEFKHSFEFDEKSNFYGLYAQNGTMKSSFAKTLQEYSKGGIISDRLFNISGKCAIDGIRPKDIISFPSFSGRAEICDEAATLVTNDAAKHEYDRALADVVRAYNVFTKQLNEAAKTTHESDTNEIVENMYRAFVSEDKVGTITIPAIVELLKSMLTEVESGSLVFCDIAYKRFTSANFKRFIGNKNYQGFFSDLAKAYDEFIDTPTYYRRGFDASSAQKLIKTIKDSKYFDASHKVTLQDKNGKDSEPIATVNDLEKSLKTDFDSIIEQYPQLKKSLEQLITDFSMGTYSDVRNIFEDNTKRDLLFFMGSEERFYKNMWYGYLHDCFDEIRLLLTAYETAAADITQALKKAEECESEWDEVVDIFNDRFNDLPYRIQITNKRDVIVHDLTRPVFEVTYKNPRNPTNPYTERPDSGNQLQVIGSVLSNGECKALYLLNVIFQLRSKLKDGDETLLVLDDIVESFDYKNKYAFFEYLQELASDYPQLYVIVLTHNFDFFRLVYEKIYPKSDEQFKIITKTKEGKLEAVQMFDPRIFGVTKKIAGEDKAAWISLIPFARNLIEYRESHKVKEYKRLTECLHIMANKPTIGDIETLISNNAGVMTAPFNQSEAVHKVIIDTADEIASSNNDNFDLHKNVTLAIGIRLVIEDYIISKLSDKDYGHVQKKGQNQTRELIKRYKNSISDREHEKKVKHFNNASMMIDSSIHLNAFMYEPLVDMGTWELKEMFNKTKDLLHKDR